MSPTLAPTRLAFVRDLDHERHVCAICVWYRALGVLLGASELALVATGRAHGFGFTSLVVAFAAGAFATGRALAHGSNAARFVTLGFSTLGLALLAHDVVSCSGFCRLATAFQALYQLAAIATLTGARATRVFSTPYREAAARDGRAVTFWSSPFFYLPLAMLALAALARMA